MRPIYAVAVFASLLLATCLQSCEEATDWDFKPGKNGQLVVDAIITNEFLTQEIQLSLSYDDLNGVPSPVSNATVWISNGQNDFLFSEAPDTPGKYIRQQPAAAQIGITYNLTIEWNGQSYTAESKMVQVFPYAKFTFQSVGQGNNVKLASLPSMYSMNQQAMYEVEIDWSHLSSEAPNRAKQIFYTFHTVDVNEVFKAEQKDVIFPRGSIVVVRKYSLNDEFADYLRALVMETEWQGGLLDEASASLPTNISNDGLGFFAACAVRRDTLIAH